MKYLVLEINPDAARSPLAMAEWIEIIFCLRLSERSGSPLAMAEWIEILTEAEIDETVTVSASDGGVD